MSHLRLLADDASGFPDDPVISLLGIAFKGRPATDDLRGTVAAPVLAALRRVPARPLPGLRPGGRPRGVAAFGLEPASGITAAFDGANLVLVLNNHPAFAEMPLGAMAARLATPGVSTTAGTPSPPGTCTSRRARGTWRWAATARRGCRSRPKVRWP